MKKKIFLGSHENPDINISIPICTVEAKSKNDAARKLGIVISRTQFRRKLNGIFIFKDRKSVV